MIRGTRALVAVFVALATPAAGGEWRPVRIGGGGFLTGIDLSADGTTRCVRTDTYGAYCWDAARESWSQVVNARSLPPSEVGPGFVDNVYELRIAPSDPKRLYMAASGYVFVSVDRGASWKRTGFRHVEMDGNDAYRTSGEKLAVDPADPDAVVLGTQKDGLWLTRDGGRTWRRDPALPATERITGIAFDGSKTIYAASASDGVFRSTNAGASFAAIPGGPAKGVRHGFARDGVYYAVSAEGKLWKYAKGAWKNFTPGWAPEAMYHSLAFDPHRRGRVVAATETAQVYVSPDLGETWQSEWYYEASVRCPDAPWLCQAYKAAYLANAAMAFDPVVPGRLWMSAGTSPWFTALPEGPPAIEWTSRVAGIEQLVASTVSVPPGGKPVVASWDFGLLRIADPEVNPTDYAPTPHEFGAAWHVDWSSADPRFLVAFLCWSGPSQSSSSSDGGVTWKPFPSVPVGNDCETWGKGGTGAAASPKSWVWVPSNRRAPYYTKDAGASWHKLVLPGVPDDDSDRGWGTLHWAFYLNRHIVTADRVNVGTYYLYLPAHGVFRSTDSAVTWKLVHKGEVAPFSGFNAKLASVPGRAGHLFFTSGQQGQVRDRNPSQDGLFMHSKDGGATWSAIRDVREVYAFGFGKAEKTYPTIFIAGWVRAQYGIWSSADEGATWTRLVEYPFGSIDVVKTIDGDKDRVGVVYVGFSGSGYAYFEAN